MCFSAIVAQVFRFGGADFGYRYRVLESGNFPLKTYENVYGCLMVVLGVVLMVVLDELYFYFIITHGITIFLCSTFLFTAPALRITPVRRVWLWGLKLIGAESEKWLYGANTKGLLIHFTAPRMISTHLVSREVHASRQHALPRAHSRTAPSCTSCVLHETTAHSRAWLTMRGACCFISAATPHTSCYAVQEMQRVSCFAIIRNPYSRMVSIFMCMARPIPRASSHRARHSVACCASVACVPTACAGTLALMSATIDGALRAGTIGLARSSRLRASSVAGRRS